MLAIDQFAAPSVSARYDVYGLRVPTPSVIESPSATRFPTDAAVQSAVAWTLIRSLFVHAVPVAPADVIFEMVHCVVLSTEFVCTV